MKEITLRQQQLIELDMLLELDQICKRHNLRYYIDGGTLLGAYCYEGFIPWDDDIDIKMPRNDYERLVEYRKELPSYIKIVCPEDCGFQYSFTKLCDTRTVFIENPGTSSEYAGNVYIDIFPMDGHNSKTLRRLERYKTLFHVSKAGFSTNFKGNVYSLLYTPKSVYKKMTRLASSCHYDSAEYVGLLIEGDTVRERMPREALDNCVELLFEGHRFPAPSKYVEHLSIFYDKDIAPLKGNLPKITTGHDYIAYWKEQ